jgi:hypothetical protein
MIRPLRRTHRAVFLLLAIVLPLVLIAALANRVVRPVQREWSFEAAQLARGR